MDTPEEIDPNDPYLVQAALDVLRDAGCQIDTKMAIWND